MFSAPSFTLFLCVAILTGVSRGKPQNSSIKSAVNGQRDQSFVVNNNCGLAKSESEMLAHIKATVDSMASNSSKESVCPDRWVLHVNSCFLVIDIPTLEWSDARRNCQKLGGDLAKITSASENQFISDLVTKQTKVTVFGVWIGLHRKADNKFYWADGKLLAGYSNWNTGEPNNSHRGQPEKCAQIYGEKSLRGKWNDLPCTLDGYFLKTAPVFFAKRKLNTNAFSFCTVG